MFARVDRLRKLDKVALRVPVEMIADDLELPARRNLFQYDKQGTIAPLEVVCCRILGRTEQGRHFVVLHPVMFHIFEEIGLEGNN